MTIHNTNLYKLLLSVACPLAVICLLYLGHWSLKATYGKDKEEQPIVEEPQPVVIDGDSVEHFINAKEVIAKGNVVVTYGDIRLTCDKIVVNTQTKEAEATGNVRLQDSRGIMETERLTYNFQNQKGDMVGVGRLRSAPYYYRANEAQRESEDLYIAKRTQFSTCNYNEPHFRIKSKRVKIIPDDKVVAYSNLFYWWKIPLFYWPVYSHSLKDPFMRVQFKTGKTKEWGFFVLSSWKVELTNDAYLRLYLDWRDRMGYAEGFSLYYYPKGLGSSHLKVYNAHERRTHGDETYHQEFQRYFVRFRHMWDIDPITKLIAQYCRIEDGRRGWFRSANFLQDYYYREYEREPDPGTYILLSRTFPYYNINMEIRKRVNRLDGVTEKLPEISYDLPDYQMGESLFYFQNQTKLASLNKKYATPSELDDDVVRLDSDNKLTLPTKFMFLELSPYLRLRETFYSKDNEGGWVSPRTAFSTGIDMSTKIYRIFNLQSNFLGLNINDLRHLIIPTIKYGYAHAPTVSNSKLQQFDDTDSIADDNRFTLTLENKLQTKRNKNTTDLAIFRVSSAYILYSKSAGLSKEEARFTDVLFTLELLPYAWLRMKADATFDHRTDDFTGVNFDSWFDFGNERTFGLGHRYIRGGSREMTSQLIWRINPKWKVRTYGRYQFTERGSLIHGLMEQEYTIIRDFHCATIEFTYQRKRKYEAKREEVVWFTFNLKMFKESEYDYSQMYHAPGLAREP